MGRYTARQLHNMVGDTLLTPITLFMC